MNELVYLSWSLTEIITVWFWQLRGQCTDACLALSLWIASTCMNAQSTDFSHLSHTPLPFLLLQTCSFEELRLNVIVMCSTAALHHKSKMQWHLWHSTLNAKDAARVTDGHLCHYQSNQTMTLTCQWPRTARKHLQRARRRRPWSNKTGEFTLPSKKSVQTVNIRGLQCRHFRVPGMSGETECWQPTLSLSKFGWTKKMIDSCRFWREKKYPLVVRLKRAGGWTVVSARSDWLTLPHLLLPLSRPP